MLKLLAIVAVAVIACKAILGKWPWQYLSTQSTRSQAVFKARQLLGVRADASRQDIVEAHRKLIAIVHPDKGGSNDQVHEANAARDILLGELPGPD